MEKIAVTKEKSGRRIDKFLAEEFFLYSRGEIVKRIKEGKVRIDNKKIKPSHVLEEGEILLLEDFFRDRQPETLFVNNAIPIEVVFENENVIFINKQAGIQVHPSHNKKENTLVNGLIARFPEIADVHDDSDGAEFRPGIVHRLDKETSGIMVIARNKKAFKGLKNLFKERKIEKKYLAIVEGILNDKSGVIDKPIARSSSYSKQVIARKNTKTIVREALTHFEVIAEKNDFSLVQASPKTGRMHQIRLHLASIGHPVVGDLVYGNKAEDELGIKRHLLHAKSISFVLLGQKYSVSAPIPADFEEFFPNLKTEQ
jgi:23S rRNA pseudouridine1911/1915/1917 synthase